MILVEHNVVHNMNMSCCILVNLNNTLIQNRCALHVFWQSKRRSRALCSTVQYFLVISRLVGWGNLGLRASRKRKIKVTFEHRWWKQYSRELDNCEGIVCLVFEWCAKRVTVVSRAVNRFISSNATLVAMWTVRDRNSITKGCYNGEQIF